MSVNHNIQSSFVIHRTSQDRCLVLTVWERKAGLPQRFHHFPACQPKLRDCSHPRNACKFEFAVTHTRTVVFLPLSLTLRAVFMHSPPLCPRITPHSPFLSSWKSKPTIFMVFNFWAVNEGEATMWGFERNQ